MKGSIAALVLLVGCSNPNPSGDGGMDSGGGDAAMQVVNGCTTFTDDTAAATPTITGPSTATPSQYTPNCVHIKVGQTVTWNSAFGPHPLQPTSGMGTTPTPITSTMTGTTVMVTFNTAGTYSFECGNHPAIMKGAVEVTP